MGVWQKIGGGLVGWRGQRPKGESKVDLRVMWAKGSSLVGG